MTIKLSFHGAAHTVTGSCFLLETGDARVLIDCGMFQGSKSEKELNYRPFPFAPKNVAAMILTHAHIDHSGLVPKLVKDGFSGPIFTTAATADLCSVMLPDSGYIQEAEVAQLNRRNEQRGRDAVEAIYTADDAQACLTQLRPVRYCDWVRIAPGVRARFWNAGHLLGSASVELEASQDSGAPKRLLFSGDIGPDHKVLQPDPEAPKNLDYVVCESTYGATERAELFASQRRKLLRAEIESAMKRNGALIIPSFAVERTQELLVDIAALMESGAIQQAPIFIDSPLATRATAVFEKHARSLDNGAELVRALNAPYVRFTESVEQSKAIGRFRGFHIVIAASGMCEAGRIRHHLKNWLWREEGTVLLVGFQAQGTLGRILQDGASRVRIQGEDIQVRARIHSLDFYSGHADAKGLVRWISERGAISGALFLVHGEEDSLAGLAARLGDANVILPNLDQSYDLTGSTARVLSNGRRRMDPAQAGRPDWHNDASKLLLDINDALSRAADAKSRAVVLRRLRRALEDDKG
jgi:metallo-beta-lactamase family protein